MQNPQTDDARSPAIRFSAAPGRFLRLKVAAIVATVALGLVGCVSLRGPVTRDTTTMTCDEPVMSPVPETPARQAHGDIAMLLAIETPECEQLVEANWRHGGSIGGLASWNPFNFRDFRILRTERDVLRLEDVGMTAVITITNQSDRVFRGEDAVWTASVDGAAIPSERGGLVGAVVPPGRDTEIRIPSIRVEASGGTYVFSIFDVPVRRNAAGETIEVGNFEWIYTLDYESVAAPAASTTCEFRVDASEFASVFGAANPNVQANTPLVETEEVGSRWRC